MVDKEDVVETPPKAISATTLKPKLTKRPQSASVFKKRRKSTEKATIDKRRIKKSPEIPYLFQRTGPIRSGTHNHPYLYSIVKTKGAVVYGSTGVTYIFEIDNLYFHVRKDEQSLIDQNYFHILCNNGAECSWKGVLHMKDQSLSQRNPQFFNPDNYEPIQVNETEKHTNECLKIALTHPPTAKEAASLPQISSKKMSLTIKNNFSNGNVKPICNGNFALLKL